MSKWQKIPVNVSFNDRFVDLMDEGIDLAIRLGGSDDSRLMTRLLAQHPGWSHAPRRPICSGTASRSMSSNWRTIAASPSFMAGARSSGVSPCTGTLGPWRSMGASAPPMPRLCAKETLAGDGIAKLATFLISDDLRAGRLVRVLEDFAANGPAVRAVYPSSRHLSPKVRSFIDELVNAWRPAPPWDRVALSPASSQATDNVGAASLLVAP